MANMHCPFLNSEVDHYYLIHITLGTGGMEKKISFFSILRLLIISDIIILITDFYREKALPIVNIIIEYIEFQKC